MTGSTRMQRRIGDVLVLAWREPGARLATGVAVRGTELLVEVRRRVFVGETSRQAVRHALETTAGEARAKGAI